MSAEKTEALVIRLVDFSETSKVVTCFTRDFGRISALAKGARRLKGPFEAALDLLARCRIVFLRKSSGLDLLTEAQLLERFVPASRDLTALYGGYYVAELLGSLTEEHDPHPPLYDEAVATLARLARPEDPRVPLVRFGLVVLREIGQLPAFDECQVCGRPPLEGSAYGFWASQGGLICARCGRDEYAGRRISGGTIAVVRRLADPGISPEHDRVVVSPQQVQEAQQIVVTALSGILGHRPKTLRYLPFS